MKVAQDTFLIQVQDQTRRDIGIQGIGGANIIIDCDYNKYKHSTQIGTIFAVPLRISSKYENDTSLNVGDTVVFHHFVCQPDHKVGDGIYRAEYFHLYAKIENNIMEAIEDIIFVEPIAEKEEDLFCGSLKIKAVQGMVRQQGIVFASSKKAQKKGIFAGDKVFFTQSADYSMKINDSDLYRMRIRNIVAVERDGEMITLSDRMLVKQIPEDNKVGILFNTGKQSQLKGEVISVGHEIKGVDVGDVISYYNGVGGNIVKSGEVYSFIELRNINYLIKNDMAQPVLDRILIKQDEAEEKVGSLYVPDNAKEKPKQGTVVAVGPGAIGNDGQYMPMQTKVGDKVIYGEFAGGKVIVNGEELIAVKEMDLILILD